jgi:hypothetical protein
VATADALAQCANYFRRMPDRGVPRRLPLERGQRSETGKKTSLTNQQLSAIFSLAKFRGLDQAAVASLTRERFTKEPAELDRQQAAQIISDLVIRHQKQAS